MTRATQIAEIRSQTSSSLRLNLGLDAVAKSCEIAKLNEMDSDPEQVCWLLDYLLAHLRTYLLTHLLTYLLTYALTYLLTHSLTHSLTTYYRVPDQLCPGSPGPAIYLYFNRSIHRSIHLSILSFYLQVGRWAAGAGSAAAREHVRARVRRPDSNWGHVPPMFGHVWTRVAWDVGAPPRRELGLAGVGNWHSPLEMSQ